MKQRMGWGSVRAVSVAWVMLGVLASSAWAARDFTPQAGTWVISEEVDGKPGRGLAIDVQGNTFFMQVFGYEKNGDATFYTATGQMDGNSVTAPLMQYQGGRSFGSEARDAVELGSPGDVTVSFENGLQGTVQFPGEPERGIKRFEMRSENFLHAYWTGRRPRSFLVTALDDAMHPAMDMHQMTLRQAYPADAWELVVNNLDLAASQVLQCDQVPDRDVFRCKQPDGVMASLGIRSLQLSIADIDVTGGVDMEVDGQLQSLRLFGYTLSAAGNGAVITGCGSYAYEFVGDLRNCARGKTPGSGTWVVADELLGKPGRGLAIDAQNGMVVAQIFNYLPSGAPSFHMGSGRFQEEEARFAISRYHGGRSLGGPAVSGSLIEATGEIVLSFARDYNDDWVAGRIRGSVQLPGELPKKIVRMELETKSNTPQAMLGQWLMQSFVWIGSDLRADTKLVNLTRVEADAAISDDGSVRCKRPSYTAMSVACKWTQDSSQRTAEFLLETNNRSSHALQVRDRHGNLTGLGNVPLD